LLRDKEIDTVKRIALILGVVAVMVAMLVALAAPAMAKDNGGHNNGGHNRLDNRLDHLDNRVDFDDGDFLGTDVEFSPVFTTNNELTDELCSPLSSEALNNTIPGCIFGAHNDDPNIGFVSGIDDNDVDFVDVDRDLGFATGINHSGNAQHNGNGNGHHNGGGGQKGNGK
jgi:hypothetical protein